MAGENIVTRVRKGMEVHTGDGQKLGKVAEVWLGTDPAATDLWCDEEICSRVEVHHGFLGRSILYIPSSAIATVAANQVTLTIDATTLHERAWKQKPHWVAQERSR